MDLSRSKNLRAALNLAGLHPRRKLDQHFLVDQHALGLIVKTAELNDADTVLEIGPGPGVLTSELARLAGQVVAVELDDNFASILTRQNLPQVEVVSADFLQFDLAQLPADYKVVANLPYAITSPILQKLLSSKHRPSSITVLVQKEVAARITARPGNMSVLALSIQYHGIPELVSVVPRASFYPPPKVDSALLHIRVQAKPTFVANEPKLFRLIKIGFAARRKMLKNNLSAGLKLPAADIEPILNRCSIVRTARAQELSLADWQRLYKALVKQL